jgi:branched-subunit amino acid ABC-type transport system permease component
VVVIRFADTAFNLSRSAFLIAVALTVALFAFMRWTPHRSCGRPAGQRRRDMMGIDTDRVYRLTFASASPPSAPPASVAPLCAVYPTVAQFVLLAYVVVVLGGPATWGATRQLIVAAVG